MSEGNSTLATTAQWRRLVALEAAAQKFIDKVDRGDARSVETYREMKEAMAIR